MHTLLVIGYVFAGVEALFPMGVSEVRRIVRVEIARAELAEVTQLQARKKALDLDQFRQRYHRYMILKAQSEWLDAATAAKQKAEADAKKAKVQAPKPAPAKAGG